MGKVKPKISSKKKGPMRYGVRQKKKSQKKTKETTRASVGLETRINQSCLDSFLASQEKGENGICEGVSLGNLGICLYCEKESNREANFIHQFSCEQNPNKVIERDRCESCLYLYPITYNGSNTKQKSQQSHAQNCRGRTDNDGKCRSCKNDVSSSIDFIAHLKSCSDTKVCSVCFLPYIYTSDLFHHMLLLHVDSVDVTFDNQTGYFALELGGTKNNSVCCICDAIIGGRGELTSHLKKLHNIKEFFYCPFCSTHFPLRFQSDHTAACKQVSSLGSESVKLTLRKTIGVTKHMGTERAIHQNRLDSFLASQTKGDEGVFEGVSLGNLQICMYCRIKDDREAIFIHQLLCKQNPNMLTNRDRCEFCLCPWPINVRVKSELPKAKAKHAKKCRGRLDQDGKCRFCKKKVPSVVLFKEHLQVCPESKICSVCYVVYYTRTDLFHHMLLSHREDVTVTFCNETGYFSVEFGGTELGYACCICDAIFDSQVNLTRHLTKIHKIKTICYCSLCFRYFPSNYKYDHDDECNVIASLANELAKASEILVFKEERRIQIGSLTFVPHSSSGEDIDKLNYKRVPRRTNDCKKQRPVNQNVLEMVIKREKEAEATGCSSFVLDNLHICIYCGTESTDEHNFIHQRVCSANSSKAKMQFCEFCVAPVMSLHKWDMTSHLERNCKGKLDSNRKCRFCGYSVPHGETLTAHFDYCPKKICCPICMLPASLLSRLFDHVVMSHVEKCNVSKDYQNGYFVVTCENLVGYACDICDVIHKNKDNLQKHRVAVHRARALFYCQKCKYYFLTAALFNKHKRHCERGESFSHIFSVPLTQPQPPTSVPQRMTNQLMAMPDNTISFRTACQFCSLEFLEEATFAHEIICKKNPSITEKGDSCKNCLDMIKGYAVDKFLTHYYICKGVRNKSNKCKFCYQVVDVTESLQQHFAQCPKSRYCPICLLPYSRPHISDFAVHIFSAHPYDCTIEKEANYFTVYFKHLKCFACDVCNHFCDNYRALQNHRYQEHGLTVSQFCRICKNKFDSKSLFTEHCKTCGLVENDVDYYYIMQLKAKMESEGKQFPRYTKNKDGQIRFTCPYCWERFSQQATLYEHIDTVCGSDREYKRKRRCEDCHMLFDSAVCLYNHNRVEHYSICKCSFCEKYINVKLNFNSHEMRCEENPERVTNKTCNYCGQVYKKLFYYFAQHQINKCNKKYGLGFHVCHVCCDGFRTGTLLRLHDDFCRRAKTTGLQECPYCFQIVLCDEDKFKSHLAECRGTEKGNTKCAFCECEFINEFNYMLHYNTACIKFREKEGFACGNCSFAATDLDVIKTHMERIHEVSFVGYTRSPTYKNKIFTCIFCEEMFKSKASCGFHVQYCRKLWDKRVPFKLGLVSI